MTIKIVVKTCRFGLGVFASEHINRGAEILRFEGPFVSADHPLNQGCSESYLIQIGPREYFYPKAPGRYVNHSCNPNAGLSNRFFLIALRDIAPSEQIFFDYSTTIDNDPWSMPCGCGEPSCRGIVGEFRHLPEHVQKTYLEKRVVAPFIAEHATCGQGSLFSEPVLALASSLVDTAESILPVLQV